MLWDLIRDFFVQHIFGGFASDGSNYGCFIAFDPNNTDEVYSNDAVILTLKNMNGDIFNISIADWLSTTATIISISIIVVLCCLFVYKIIKLIGGLIR